MRQSSALVVMALVTLPAMAGSDVVYSNTTTGPTGEYAPACGVEFGDLLHMTSGGIWDGIEFTFGNSRESPSRLVSSKMIFTVYNWDEGEMTYVAAWVVPLLVSDLEPGEYVTFAQDGYYTEWGEVLPIWNLDSTIAFTMIYTDCVWEGEPGQLGQLLFDPPTVGWSADDYCIWDDGWQWLSLGGDLVANFACEIEVYRCDGPGNAAKYCTSDIYPNDGDGVWDPLWGGDGDCRVDLADVAQLLGNYGIASGATREDGDVYPEGGDGAVNLADIAEMLGQYGDDCSAALTAP